MRAPVLQHIACEPPGIYEDVLTLAVGVTLSVNLARGYPIASLLTALSIAATLYGLWLRAGRPSGVSEAERIAAAPELVARAAAARAADRS
jgi:hypothetical protein